jgi:hypothetical protein
MQYNSPYVSLAQTLYSPSQTAASSSQMIGGLSSQYGLNAALKSQPLNTGLHRSLSAGMKGQSNYDVARKTGPLGQAFGDAAANAQYGLGVQQANEGFGLDMLNRYGRLGPHFQQSPYGMNF